MKVVQFRAKISILLLLLFHRPTFLTENYWLTICPAQVYNSHMVGGAPPPGPPLGHAHDTSYRTKVRDSSYCLPSALVDTFPAFKFSFFYFIQLVEIIMSLETPLKKKEVLLLSQYGKASLNRKRLRKLVGNKIKGVHFSENWGIKLNLKITTLFYWDFLYNLYF